MTLFPEVQRIRIVQEEIDLVAGPGSLPTVADRENPPYINAVVKKVLRRHPVAPIGIPNMSVEGGIYEGF